MIKKYYTQERLALPQMRILVFSSPPPARASRSDGASFFCAARMKRQKVSAEF